MIDCLDLTSRFCSILNFFSSFSINQSFPRFNSTELPGYAKSIADKEPLLYEEIFPEFVGALERLQLRLLEPVKKKFYHYKTLKTHILPLTNVAFDKSGSRYVPCLSV